MGSEKSGLHRKIKSYAVSATSLLAASAAANAQIIYTDINPDKILDTDTASYQLDLNNDSMPDYTFSMDLHGLGRGVVMAPGYSISAKLYDAIGGSLKKNAYNGYYGYPYVFSQDKQIGDSVKFFDVKDLLFVVSGRTFFFDAQLAFTFRGNKYGHWFGAKDMYMPLRISTASGNYYGWIRCDVSSDGFSITLKDYAYNATPGAPILAGEGNAIGINDVNRRLIKVFAFDGKLNVIMNEKINNASLQITDALGRLMKTVELNNSVMQLNISDLAPGIYIVTINNGGKIFTTKIALQK